MGTLKEMQDIYKETQIWKHFVSITKPNTDKQTFVFNLIKDASSILDRIIETFPTYTLHNGQHQLNILNLYEKLLGTKIDNLTDLETAILILSAFYHDIGMVFNNLENEDLKEEQYFSDFLAANDLAKLSIAEDKCISPITAEWYCRWSHAKRVWKYLDTINDKLFWEGNNIRKELAEVCLSHNEKTEYIKDNYISSNSWNKSDLKFCAIILRLADILDFDDTRTPRSIYDFLNLDDPNNKNEQLSQREWQKHFASRGFTFDKWNQDNNYTIDFQAAPKNPSIEHDILEFLNYIEKEFKECSSILRFCSDRWKDFKLPEKIDRQNIKSQGYTFGDFKFSLDQKHVLSLLMGENLYESQYVFIRELLQNAIDTSRHRKFYENSKGNMNFTSNQINVSTWYDSDGYRWIRVDDFGMGMTFSQISKYFLKVGSSYYNSDEFKVEKLSYSNKKDDFLPVSRFGIGILSCFIVGDIVEVNTKSIFSNKRDIHPLRLSLKGMYNYYVLQTDKDIPSEMPSCSREQNAYRKDIGTSIAIRIKPNYDLPDFDLSKILDSILFNPEVTVNLIDKGKKGRYLNGLDRDNIDIIKHTLNSNEINKITDFIRGLNILSINPVIRIIPINLNRVYSHPNITGFLYIFLLEPNIVKNNNYHNDDILDETDIQQKRRTPHTYIDDEIFRLSYWHYNNKFSLGLRMSKYINSNNEMDDVIDLTHLLKPIEIFNGNSNLNSAFDSIVLSHNGIIIPNMKDSKIQLKLDYPNEAQIIGFIQLSDKLRPNLSVARSSIISIP